MRYLFYILLLIPFIQCKCNNEQSDSLLSRSDVRNIKKEFSEEEILFFYECALHKDRDIKEVFEEKDFFVEKWDKDIHLCILGNPTKEDSLIVNYAVSSINNINLPISINIVLPQDTLKNAEIYFDIKDSLYPIFGKDVYQYNGFTSLVSNAWAKIIIPDNSKATKEKKRVVLHELLNILGLGGDQLSFMNSVLYDDDIPFTNDSLSVYDIQALRLLYSPYIRIGLTKVEFKKKFKDIIPNNEITDEDYRFFEKYIKQSKYSFQSILLFQTFAFTDNSDFLEPHIAKWSNQPIIGFLSDDQEKKYYKIINSIKDTINIFLKDKKIGLTNDNTIPYNIIIKDPNLEDVPIIGVNTYTIKSFYNYQIIKSILKIDNNLINEKCNYKYLFSSVIKTLGINFDNYEKLINNSINSIFYREDRLTSIDKEFLELYLSHYVKTGMEKDKIEIILKKYYPELLIDEEINKNPYEILEEIIKNKPLSNDAYTFFVNLINSSQQTYIYKFKPNSFTYKISEILSDHKPTIIEYINRFAQITNKKIIDIDNIPYCNIPNLLIDSTMKSSTAYIDTYGSYLKLSINIDKKMGIKEELSKLFIVGLFPENYSSIIKDWHKPTWIEACKFFYHPALKAGMEKRKVMAIFEKYYGKPNEHNQANPTITLTL